jgi:spore coat polysaccharide biosynthesis protein SpsF
MTGIAKIVACVIARTVSTRLPLKVLRHVHDSVGMLDFILQRVKLVSNIDEVYLCTSRQKVDDILEDIADKNNVNIYRGSPDAVIERMIGVAEKEHADHVIRITGDNVFAAYEYVGKQIEVHIANDLDYTRIKGLPIGATAEIMKLSAVKACYLSIDPSVSEYLMLYMFDPSKYRCGVIKIKNWPDYSSYSLTVDTNEDLERTRNIIAHYRKDFLEISLKSILEIIEMHKIANSVFKLQGLVKMPYGKTITFAEFQKEMSNRISQSMHFEIDPIS